MKKLMKFFDLDIKKKYKIEDGIKEGKNVKKIVIKEKN
jgi:hypothetical protein